MLTKKSYKYLGQHFWVSSVLGVMPFNWDFKTETLHYTRSNIKLLVTYFNALTSYAVTTSVYYSFFLGVIEGKRNITLLAVDLLFLMAWTSQVFFQFKIFINPREMAEMINHILSFDKLYTKKYFPSKEAEMEKKKGGKKNVGKVKKVKEKSDGCDGNIFASLYMLSVYSAVTVAMFWKKPEDTRFLYRLIPPEYKSQWTLYGWAAMEFFHTVKFCLIFNNTFYIIMLYAHCTNFWLHHLSKPDSKGGVKGNVERSVRTGDVIPNYKAIQVLNLHFNECCSRILLPTFKCLCIGLHVMALYTTIKYYDVMPLDDFLMYPMGDFMWFAIELDIFTLLGQTFQLSQRYLESWKMTLGVQGKRYFASLFALGIKVSSAYTIERSTVLTVWSTVFNLLINAILF